MARRPSKGGLGGPARTRADARIVALVSGRRGVGKTSLALNLAARFSRCGARTLLLNAQPQRANGQAGPSTSPAPDWTGQQPPLSCAPPDSPRGLTVAGGMPACADLTDLDSRGCLRAAERLRRAFDMLVVNCPAGVSATAVGLALAADRLVVVTTAEPTALVDAYAMLKLLVASGFDGAAGVVLNMVASLEEGRQAAWRLRQTAERFLGLSLGELGCVPLDGRVSEAARRGVPVVLSRPNCAASCHIGAICSSLAARRAGALRSRGWWLRIASLFL